MTYSLRHHSTNFTELGSENKTSFVRRSWEAHYPERTFYLNHLLVLKNEG